MAARKQPNGLAAVVGAGDRRASLEALRDDLARSIQACDSMRDKAALGRLLKDVLADIANLPTATEVSAADEIAKRRAARRAGASGKARAARSG